MVTKLSELCQRAYLHPFFFSLFNVSFQFLCSVQQYYNNGYNSELNKQMHVADLHPGPQQRAPDTQTAEV